MSSTRGSRSAVRLEVPARAQDDVDLLDHVHRQPDRARLVHDRALDVLADPPRRVGREAKTPLRVELLERVHQAEVALLHQVEQRHAAVEVLLRHAHDEPQVVLDHLLARREVALRCAPGVVELLLRREEAVQADLVEIELRDVREEVARRPARPAARRFLGAPPRERAPRRARQFFGRDRVGIGGGHRLGRYCSGSTGLPSRRISKWSLGSPIRSTRPPRSSALSRRSAPLLPRSGCCGHKPKGRCRCAG